jgi:hypothetical protein
VIQTVLMAVKVKARVVYACASALERALEKLSSQDTFLDSNRSNE